MKYQNNYFGTKAEFADFVKKTIPDFFAGRLEVEGKRVALPPDAELDYKVKYDEDEYGGSFSIKVSWETGVREEEDEEVEVDTD
ncbi:MAG: amphi-Trp domain-containing protein [Clostridia bacterium]|nr:amphi-Trp domain-containing protein [Clostridia bacterium]